jgi:hypothetical protein
LKNVTPGEPLAPFLLSRPLLPRLSGTSDCLQGDWVSRFLEQLAEVLDRAQRMQDKSLGGLLALQEKLAEQWAAPARCPGQAVAAPLECAGGGPPGPGTARSGAGSGLR